MTPRNGGAASQNIRAVRLTDIPIAVRRRYGEKLMDEMSDNQSILAALQMNEAIETPTEKVYWVPCTKKSENTLKRLGFA